MDWTPTPRGYTTFIGFNSRGEDIRCTVFVDLRLKRWKYVVNSEFSPPFDTVFQAVDSAERRHSFMASRGYLRDEKNTSKRFSDFHREKAAKERAYWKKREKKYQQPNYAPPPKSRYWWAAVLGLEGDDWRSGDLERVRVAFVKLVKIHHPDVGGTAEDFQRIHDAWQAAQADLQDEPPF